MNIHCPLNLGNFLSSLATGSLVKTAVTPVVLSTIYRKFIGINYDKSHKIFHIGCYVAKSRTPRPTGHEWRSWQQYSKPAQCSTAEVSVNDLLSDDHNVFVCLFVDTVHCSEWSPNSLKWKLPGFLARPADVSGLVLGLTIKFRALLIPLSPPPNTYTLCNPVTSTRPGAPLFIGRLCPCLFHAGEST